MIILLYFYQIWGSCAWQRLLGARQPSCYKWLLCCHAGFYLLLSILKFQIENRFLQSLSPENGISAAVIKLTRCFLKSQHTGSLSNFMKGRCQICQYHFHLNHHWSWAGSMSILISFILVRQHPLLLDWLDRAGHMYEPEDRGAWGDQASWLIFVIAKHVDIDYLSKY